MLPKCLVIKHIFDPCQKSTRILNLTFLLFSLFFAETAFAQDPATPVTSVSAMTMLLNFANSVPNLMRLVTAMAYVIGMFLVISGVIKFKHFGESRTMMSSEHSLTGPMVRLLAGALLIYLPTAVQMGTSTFWGEPNPYGYVEQTDQWTNLLNSAFMVVQLVGTIAFIRGVIILSHLGGPGGHQQGGLGKGITHIVGGIFCINIYQFVQVILTTLGIQT